MPPGPMVANDTPARLTSQEVCSAIASLESNPFQSDNGHFQTRPELQLSGPCSPSPYAANAVYKKALRRISTRRVIQATDSRVFYADNAEFGDAVN